MLGSGGGGGGGEEILLVKGDADCLGGGEPKAIFRPPLLDTVKTQLHSPNSV